MRGAGAGRMKKGERPSAAPPKLLDARRTDSRLSGPLDLFRFPFRRRRRPGPAPWSSSLVVAWNLSFLDSSSPSTSTMIVFLPVNEPRSISSAERVFDQVLDGPAERPGTVVGVVALVDQEVLGLVGEDQFQAAIGHPAADLGQLDVDDLLQVVLVERAEDDDVVEPVEELGPEVLLDGDLEPLLHLLVAAGLVAAAVEPEDVGATR